ncbi:IclR family transcriptional regulator C-terminal domain-containing protein [Pelagibacterium sp. H642]|uniref:IclR family transcriptional regulator n=1 Tax=Pelagibacterium sp. H642 TaxID=1881069 RepID=UPI0028153FFA|nr:IclR family transcriptional regulator C-terminal domain-containing protein [Pelagibacterium sp. H642]WMT91050.1 helix-turn-helix domain-containing protein [Pelagibacterium sp. H642]
MDDIEKRSGTVQAVDRAMAILEVLGDDEEGCRLTDIARRTGLSVSTVHRLLTTLEQRRFVQFDRTDGMWHVGRGAFAVGSAFTRQRNFVAPALPILRRLRNQTRETANLGVVDDGEVVVLTQVESREIMRAITRVGGRAPMVNSGMGKAILASYADADIDALINRQGLRKATGKSITSTAILRDEIAAIREKGFAFDDEEFVTGLRCVASVVYGAQAEPLCAISISGLSVRVTDDRVEALGKLIAEAARELTMSLGGRAPER